MILIDAVYINTSGGKILLEYIIESIFLGDSKDIYYFLIDSRLESNKMPLIPEGRLSIINASELVRRSFYQKELSRFDSIFCFGNVPPPIKIINKPVYIYFHNSLFLDYQGKNYGILARSIFRLKRIYINYLLNKNYWWIVQTKSMKSLLNKRIGVKIDKIKVLPIFNVESKLGLNKQLKENMSNYLYVADGVAQKNHQLLLRVWETIFEKYKLGLTLHLTVPFKYQELCKQINSLVEKGVKIVNHGYCSSKQIESLYEICNYFLMPSLSESFGLPLIEAAKAGCEIIAADLDYVYDVVHPMSVFNPYDDVDLLKCIIDSQKTKAGSTELIVKNEIENLLILLTEDV